MRLLGIDAGEKRIGIALSDRLNKTASPLTVLDNDENLKRNLLEIVRENEIKKIIIGLPYTLKGTKGCQAKIVEDFIENILKNIAEETSTEIIEIDERFTSKISEKLTSVKTGKKSGKVIDSIAAAVLLNDYIEREKKVENH